MDPLIVLVTVFAIFIPALILPGPDFIAVVRSSTTRGMAAGLLTTLGVTLGLGLYATLSLLGLSAILQDYQWLAWLVRALGGAYLIWLGIGLLRAKPEDLALDTSDARARGNPAVFGFLVTLTTPKAVVLFTSVFATAVTDATPGWLFATMIALVMTSAFLWYAVVSLFMASPPVMKTIGRIRHWVERVAGAGFVLIGGRILTDTRNPATP